MWLRLSLALALIVAIVASSLPSSFAWGDNAQRLIANKAVETLPDEIRPFFEANRQFLLQHVADPEEAEKKDPTLENLDFIKLDHYGQFPFSNASACVHGGRIEIWPAIGLQQRSSSMASGNLQQKANRRVP